MNLNRLLLVAIGAPSVFVVTLSLLSYFPHQAGLLTHEGEHLTLAGAMVGGIVPFSFLMVHIFRRIERHVLKQNTELSRRAREMEALLTVGRAVEESLDLDRVLPAALEALLGATTAESAEVWLVDPQAETVLLRHHQGEAREAFLETTRFGLGQGYPGLVATSGRPILVHDLASDPRFARERVKAEGFQTLYAVPLGTTSGTIGALLVASRDPEALTEEAELRLLQLMAEHLATAVENSRLKEEVQTLAILTERERLAREMHDGLGQVLGYVNTKAQAVKELLRSGEQDGAIGQMEQLESAAQETYDDVREAILALSTDSRRRPLVESLREYLDRFSGLSELPTDMQVRGEPSPFNPAVEVQIIRIVQEALANARKHAHASRAGVVLRFEPGRCEVRIEDDGVGFDPDHRAPGPRPHLGLRSMQERASAIGGRFRLDTAPGNGTRVIVDLPTGGEGEPAS